MAIVRITGWKLGFRKISHTKLLQDHAGLRLAEAKDVTDRVLRGETVELEVGDRTADAFLAQLHELGAVAGRAVASDSGDR